jgi:uncharacterized membrane protein YecN with MAPEG domain
MGVVHPPVISALTAGVLVILQMLLSLGVSIRRRGTKTSLGNGDDPALLRAVRRHGNLAENAGLFVACFALLEMMGPANLRLFAALCLLFVFGRLIHAIGLSLPNTSNLARTLGVLITVGVGVVLGLRLISIALPLLPHFQL